MENKSCLKYTFAWIIYVNVVQNRMRSVDYFHANIHYVGRFNVYKAESNSPEGHKGLYREQ